MCCCRIDTDALLANLYSASPQSHTIKEIEQYVKYLTERFPIYVTSNFSLHSVRDCADKYPELYCVDGNGNEVIVRSMQLVPNLEHFNSIYNEAIANYIVCCTKNFINFRKEAS